MSWQIEELDDSTIRINGRLYSSDFFLMLTPHPIFGLKVGSKFEVTRNDEECFAIKEIEDAGNH